MAGYRNRTNRYQIGTIGHGEYVSESEEERSAQIVESQLIGAISAHSGGHGLFNNGVFSVAGDAGGFIVTLNPIGGTPAAEGFIRLIYFKITETIQWAFQGDGTHSLYLQLVDDSSGSTRQFGDVAVDSTLGVLPDDALLIAEVSVSGDGAVVNEAPSSRLDIAKLQDHIDQNVNPHTALLNQDQMIISSLSVQQTTTETLVVAGELHLSGTAIFQQDVTLEQDLIVNGDLLVSGTSLFNREAKFLSTALIDQAVVSDMEIRSGLDVLNTVRFFNHIELLSGVTVDGRDLGQDGLRLDNHISGIAAFLNPHGVTAAQVSGIPVSGSANGGPTLVGNLNMLSGLAIDEIDPSTLIPLLDGSNADNLHTHDMSGIQDNFLSYSPEYGNAVLSGAGSTVITTYYDEVGDFTAYQVVPTAIGVQEDSVVVRTGVPSDFKQWGGSGITLFNGVSDLANVDNHINLRVIDTAGTEIVMPNSTFLRNPVITATIFPTTILNTGTFTAGEIFTTIVEASTLSGVAAAGGINQAIIGDLIFEYETLFKL